MTSDELKTHAAEGRIKLDSGVQKIGNEEWFPASKIAALWNASAAGAGAAAGGAAAGGAAGAHGDHQDMHDSRAGSAAGIARSEHGGSGNGHGNGHGHGHGHGHADGAGASTGTGASHERTTPTPQPNTIGQHHPARIGESIQHLLQRAVLGHVTLCAPEFDGPQKVILAGVTGHDVAFEFESCGTVVYLPYARLRSVTVPRSYAHSSGRIRAQAELLVIEVDHIPQAVVHAMGQAAQGAQATA